MNVWDGFNKKRLRQYPKYPSSVASMSFNSDGTSLAIASSYCFEEGEKECATDYECISDHMRSHEPDTVFIKSIADAEVRPKTILA